MSFEGDTRDDNVDVSIMYGHVLHSFITAYLNRGPHLVKLDMSRLKLSSQTPIGWREKTASRRTAQLFHAGSGLDSRRVRSPTGEHETRAKDHAWRRKGRIPRVAERLLHDVGGEGKRSLPRALFGADA